MKEIARWRTPARRPRATIDDHALIDAAVSDSDTNAVRESSGGALQTDIGSQDDISQAVTDPGGTTRPEKSDDIANNQAHDSDRRGANEQ